MCRRWVSPEQKSKPPGRVPPGGGRAWCLNLRTWYAYTVYVMLNYIVLYHIILYHISYYIVYGGALAPARRVILARGSL